MVEIHILSLFPESFSSYLDSSIMKRAQEKGLFQYTVHNLTDWSVRNTRRVDDRPYGGWAGTIITIEPLVTAIRILEQNFWMMKKIYFSPRGTIINQEYFDDLIPTLWSDTKFLLICSHYEGIDERLFEFFDITTLSLGRFVISSGELASMIWIDALVRLIPWVISEDSLREESFSKNLCGKKEYPQYSRPESFEWKEVPKVLLSWDQKRIHEWKSNHLSD